MTVSLRLAAALRSSVLAASAAALSAQTSPAPIDTALRNRFGFVGPIVEKLGEGTSALQVAAVSRADQRMRAVLGNTHRARLEAWRVQGEHAEKVDWPLDAGLNGLALADLDGDGEAEVVTVDDSGRLRLRRAGGSPLRAPLEVGKPALAGCLRLGDLDGDGAADAAVLAEDGLRVITKLIGEPQVGPAAPIGTARATGFHLCDIDGDRKLDVLLALRAERMALRLKLGTGDPARPFGPWLVLDPSNLAAAFPGSGEGASLATLEAPHRRLVEYAFARGAVDLPAAQLTALPNANARPLAQGDVDGDGDIDLVVAQPDRAELTFLLETDGTLVPHSAPSLAGITSLAAGDFDGDGKLDIVLASPDEDALAWKSGALPLDAFPQRLPAADKPVAVGFDGPDVLFVARNDKRDAALYRLERAAKAPRKLADLGRITADPARLLVGQFDDAHGRDVAFVVPGVGLRALFAQPDGTLKGSDQVPGFTKRLEDGALSLTPHGDGAAALTVVRDRFVRTFRFDATGQSVILSQDNGPAGADTLGLLAQRRDGVRFLLDPQGQRLYRQDGSKAPRAAAVPAAGITQVLAHGDGALLLCAEGVVRLSFDEPQGLKRVRSAEPPTDKSACFAGFAADLDGDGKRELAVLDAQANALHVFVPQGDQLARALSFPIFERTDTARASLDPREFACGDLDGDGRTDLAFLCHDRLLIYLQEK